LKNISLEVKRNELVAIVGPTGSGKSTLLHSIMGEMNLTSGTMNVSGRIAYVEQSPFIISGTLKENILFGNQFDSSKFKTI